MFTVGQKVKCIDNSNASELEINEVYTVTGANDMYSSILLDEIPGSFFGTWRFMLLSLDEGIEHYESEKLKGDPAKASTTQVGGSHYKDMAIQPIDFILANGLGYCEANVVKYICRHEKKNGLQDLEKAKHYIDLIIEKKYKTEKP
jgi:hypothetical protein